MSKPPDLASRIRQLIESSHPGSLRKAAHAIGIPQQTLDRISKGESSPRADTLHKIAEFYGATVEWLLTGKGTAPPEEFNASGVSSYATQLFEWQAIVRSLELEKQDAAALMELPRALTFMLYSFTLNTPLMNHPQSSKVRETDEFYAAIRKHYDSWIQHFREWIRQAGTAMVRQQLTTPKMRKAIATRLAGMK